MEDNRVECPNWWEVIRWLFTSVAKNVNLGLHKQIQLVVRVGLERGVLQLQVECSYRLATLPPYKRSEWVYEAFHPMDQRWKSYAITDDKSEKRTRLFLRYPYWFRKWGRGQGTHRCYLFIHLYSLRRRPSPFCSSPLRTFCSADLPPCEMSLAARSQGRQLLLQAIECSL